jgi:hypothetical protein
LLDGLLDVAVLRVTDRMLAEHPSGWRHRRIRLEPMLLVGRDSDERRDAVSLFERPIEVFADPPDSGMYNAHGEYLTALERRAGLSARWLGNPGTFNHCLAAVRRTSDRAYVLEFGGYAERYAEAGLPVYRPEEVQPYYPWSIAWRDEAPSRAVADLVHIAGRTAERRGWLEPKPLDDTPAWVPEPSG